MRCAERVIRAIADSAELSYSDNGSGGRTGAPACPLWYCTAVSCYPSSGADGGLCEGLHVARRAPADKGDNRDHHVMSAAWLFGVSLMSHSSTLFRRQSTMNFLTRGA